MSTRPGNLSQGMSLAGVPLYVLFTLVCSHRHVRYGLFFHSLAMIQCLRHGSMPDMQQMRYINQLELNQHYLRS